VPTLPEVFFMNRPLPRRLLRLALTGGLAGALVMFAACSQPPPKPVSEGELNIRKFGRLYLAYAAAQKDHLGPASVEELKKFAEGLDEKRLAALDLKKEEINSVFVSPRDNQPYGIVPKVMPFGGEAATDTKAAPKGGPAFKGPPVMNKSGVIAPPKVIVYEKTGSGGRLVMMNNTDVHEVSDAEFTELVPNPK
jgi:hypothetical protein